MAEQNLLSIICIVVVIAYIGGLLTGLMWRVFRENDRDSSRRYPRPGTKPYRPPGLKPFKRSPEMLKPDETENP